MPGPYPPAYGQPAVPARSGPGANGFAIAALILAICGAMPISLILAVIFGVLALAQIRKSGQRGRGMAITGLSLAGFWAIALVIGLTYTVTNGSWTPARPDPNQSIPAPDSGPQLVAIEDVQAGDCVNNVTEGASVSMVLVLPCEQPHRAEVIGQFTLPSGRYPGEDVVDQRSGSGCSDLLNDYWPSSADDPGITVFYFPPGEDTWGTSGGRSVVCMAVMKFDVDRSIRS